MRTVWKVEIKLGVNNKILLPEHSKCIHFGAQMDKLMGWFEVRTENREVGYQYCIFGTGHEVPEGWEHCRSMVAGAYVWHLYKYYSVEENPNGKEKAD